MRTMRHLLLLALPALIAAADPAQQLAAELVRARIPQDPARAATYQRIADLLAAGRCSPADAVALLDLAAAAAPALAPRPADPAAVVAALDGDPAPVPAVPVPVPATAPLSASPAPRPVVQALAGGDGQTVAVAVGSEGLAAGDRLRIERGEATVGVVVITRIQGGLALASVIPETASGAMFAGDRAVPIIR
jgi:hypothetical protein